MSLAINVIPANPEDHCHCCGRVHRKLYNIDGYWLGANCAEAYKIYKHNKDVTSVFWHGWEKQFAQVAKMVNSQPGRGHCTRQKERTMKKVIIPMKRSGTL